MNSLRHLYRFDCPNAAVLRDYVWQDLDPATRQTVRQHLDVCPLCRDELSQLEAVWSESKPAAAKDELSRYQTALLRAKDFLENVRWVVATTVSGSSLETAGAFRADVHQVVRRPWSILLDAEETMISVVAAPDEQDCYTLTVHPLADRPSESMRCQLIPNRQDTPYMVADGRNENATFLSVPPGDYVLVVRFPQSTVFASGLSLR